MSTKKNTRHTVAELRAKTRKELADMAREYGVVGWYKLKKEDLVKEVKKAQPKAKKVKRTTRKPKNTTAKRKRTANKKAAAKGYVELKPRKTIGLDGWTTNHPLHALAMGIFKADIERAAGHCGDPTKCVIAQSLKATFGPLTGGIIDCNIGKTIAEIKLHAIKTVLRYSVPKVLGDALAHWDKTGDWGLEEGSYYLNPISDDYINRASRHNLIKNKKGGKATKRGNFKSTTKIRSTPTRKMQNICELKRGKVFEVDRMAEAEELLNSTKRKAN